MCFLIFINYSGHLCFLMPILSELQNCPFAFFIFTKNKLTMKSIYQKNYTERGYLMNYRKFDHGPYLKKQIFQFYIEMTDIQQKIWRRIQVPGHYNFWELHVAKGLVHPNIAALSPGKGHRRKGCHPTFFLCN